MPRVDPTAEWMGVSVAFATVAALLISVHTAVRYAAVRILHKLLNLVFKAWLGGGGLIKRSLRIGLRGKILWPGRGCTRLGWAFVFGSGWRRLRLFDGKVNFASLIEPDDFDLDGLSFRDMVVNIIYIVVCDFRDVNKTVTAVGQRYKGTKFGNSCNLALKYFSHCWLHIRAFSSCLSSVRQFMSLMISVVDVVKNFFSRLDKAELASGDILDRIRVCAVIDRVLELGIRLKDAVDLAL